MIKRIKKLYKFLFKEEERKAKFPVEIKGTNWIEKKELPIAIFFNFNPWKRELFSSLLSEYRCAFIVGKNLYSKKIYNFLNTLKKNNEIIFVNWGEKPLPYLIRFFLFMNPSIKVLSIEDGFLRSFEVGVLHTRPSSICIDDKRIYFNAYKETTIEYLLNNSELKYLSKKQEMNSELN